MKKIGSDPKKTGNILSVFMMTISVLTGCAFLFAHYIVMGILWLLAGVFFLLGYLHRMKK